jgi:hypothetical protein
MLVQTLLFPPNLVRSSASAAKLRSILRLRYRTAGIPELRGKKDMFTTRRAVVALASAPIVTRVTGLKLAHV